MRRKSQKNAITFPWKPVDEMENSFTLGKKAAYWKGKKGWWASRADEESFKRFRSEKAARNWAEEPLRTLAEAKITKRTQRQAEQQAKRGAKVEARAVLTWGDLQPNQRVLVPHQIWAMKGVSLQDNQVLLLAVQTEIVVVLVRKAGEGWDAKRRDVRGIKDLLRLYRYVGCDHSGDVEERTWSSALPRTNPQSS